MANPKNTRAIKKKKKKIKMGTKLKHRVPSFTTEVFRGIQNLHVCFSCLKKIPFRKLFDLFSKNVGLIAESLVAEKIQQKGFVVSMDLLRKCFSILNGPLGLQLNPSRRPGRFNNQNDIIFI